MPWFFKQQNSLVKDSLTDDEKIALVDKAYAGFQKKLSLLEKERDEKIAEILKTIDNRKIHDILRRVEAK